MSKAKFFISLILTSSILIGQVGIVFAAPALQESAPLSGTVQSITLETDPNTGITAVILEIACADQTMKTVRISQATASAIGLVVPDGDGNLVINEPALGESIEIDPATVTPDQQQERHPVGNALATFFSDIVDYDTVMAAHEQGVGFGVIAQALWLTKQLNGNKDVFTALLDARKTGDYSAFTFDDGTMPKNWGQLRKSILDGKKVHKVASHQNNGNNQNKGNKQDKDQAKDKDKNKDNGNNGGGNDKNKEKKK
ncbi:MAG TPA: hypothetical protein VLE49_04300 [Anaerolineales bacterium]|nr:hypothetical protein [Anaerolineales bacterium]